MSNSLPTAQELYERFADDERVRVVAVATAFEKDRYPWMGDLERIRGTLQDRGWNFPVMRDEDERTVRMLGFADRWGTPTTLVIDPEGVVRWHAFNTTAATAAEVEATVDGLLAGWDAAPIDGLPDELAAYGKGDYAKAYGRAEARLGAGDARLRAAAEQVIANVDAAIERRVRLSGVRRAAGFPSEARTHLEQVVELFAGVPAAEEVRASLAALEADEAFAAELEGERRLDAALARLRDPEVKRSAVKKELRAVKKELPETPIAERAHRALVRLT